MLPAMLKRSHILLRSLLLTLTFALTVAGIGHPPPTSDDLARAEFELVFGDEICGIGADEAGESAGSCPLCRIVAAYVAPEPTVDVERLVFTASGADWTDRGPPALRPAPTERPPLRGPPPV